MPGSLPQSGGSDENGERTKNCSAWLHGTNSRLDIKATRVYLHGGEGH